MNATLLQEDAATRCLWFRRGQLRFALNLSELVEVHRIETLRPLPMAVDSLAGFVKYRGRVLPVFDPLPLAGLVGEPPRLPMFAAFASIDHEPALALLLDEVGRMLPMRFAGELPMASGVPGAFGGVCQVKQGMNVVALNVRGLARAMQFEAVSNCSS